MAQRERNQGPRPTALIIERQPWAPPEGAVELAEALRDDLVEVLSAARLPVGKAGDVAGAARTYAREQRPLLLAFPDVPALPLLCVEGALQDLRDHALAVGPCADGGVYLLALTPGLPADAVTELIEAAVGQSLSEMCDLLDELGLPVSTMPPWFRVRGAGELAFAEQLARLSIMSEGGDDDFLADRLRLWFERYADA